MAFAPHYRVSFGGPLYGGDNATPQEIWQCNVNVVPGAGGSIDEDTYLSQIKTPLTNWFKSADSGNSVYAGLGWIKCNHIGADGKYTDATSTHVIDLTPVVHGGVSPVNPDIMSVVTSWGTAKVRGPGSKGRIYLPNQTYGDSVGMTIPVADQNKAVAAGVALLKVLNNADDTVGNPAGTQVVATPVIASNVNATNTDIVLVRVGDVKDVQRRRKDAIKETYQSGLFLSVAG
jgi:hypothetical protein